MGKYGLDKAKYWQHLVCESYIFHTSKFKAVKLFATLSQRLIVHKVITIAIFRTQRKVDRNYFVGNKSSFCWALKEQRAICFMIIAEGNSTLEFHGFLLSW